jgi:ABC-type phosphate transport system substrate-binding protein
MMRVLTLLILASMTLLSAEPFVLVTHPQSPIETLSDTEVMAIYLKQRRYWNGLKLEPLQLPPENELRQAFEKRVLDMTSAQLENYWLKQHYKGLRPPYRVESIESLLLFVKKVEGAIGYIPLSSVDQGVKVIYREAE